MTKELLYEVEIPLYIRTYIKSNSVREKYYEKNRGRELPLKYCDKHIFKTQEIKQPDGINYCWKEFPAMRKGKKTKVDILIDKKTGKRVVYNEEYVGKQNIKNINGQDIYNGSCSRHDRNNMLGQIKDMYRTAFRDMSPITRYPLRLDVILFDTIIDDTYSNGQEWDADNRFFPYGKGLSDLLKKEGKIIDDSILYITEPPHPIFVPVEEESQRRFIVAIYKDNRKFILENWLYKAKHGENLK